MQNDALALSPEGFTDLEDFHSLVVINDHLALRVLTTGHAGTARPVVEEKARVRIEEQRLRNAT